MTTIPNWMADRALDVVRGIPTDLLFEQNDSSGEILLEADTPTGVLDLGERWYALNTANPGEAGADQATGLDPYPLQVHQVQSIATTGVPTGGTFTVTDWATPTPNESAAIAFDAGALAVQAALEALAEIGAGNVLCYGGPLTTNPVLCVFVRALGQQEIDPLVLADNSLTGGTTPDVAIVDEQIGGVLLAAYVDAAAGVERETETSAELVLGNATAGETVSHQSLLTGESGDFAIGGALTSGESYSLGAPVSVPAGNVRMFSRGTA
jgi:hypothetical protein